MLDNIVFDDLIMHLIIVLQVLDAAPIMLTAGDANQLAAFLAVGVTRVKYQDLAKILDVNKRVK